MDVSMRSFRVGHAVDDDWDALAHSCIEQIGASSHQGNLGFVYATDALAGDFGRIVDLLRDATGITEWVGTVGFGVCVAGQEYFDRPALAVLVGALPADDFRIVDTVSQPGEALSKDVSAWVSERMPTLGIVHADPRNQYLPQIIDSIGDDVDCFLVGGLTASRGECHQVAGTVTKGGVSGVLLADTVPVSCGLTQGCTPIGPVREVTEVSENIIKTLDGKPALDAFKNDIGEELASDLRRVGGFIHAALPVSGTDMPDYLVRNLVGIDPDQGWIAIGERLQVGDRLMFVRRDASSAMADLDRMLGDIIKRAESAPKAALYFSCVARGPNLFGDNSEELSAVSEAIGEDVPIVGFFANGEICNNRLYGYTGVLTLLM